MISFTVQGTPVQQVRIRISSQAGKSRACYDDETAEYMEMVRRCAIEAQNGCDSLTGPLAMIVDCTYPVPDSWPAHRRQAALHGAWYAAHEDVNDICKVIADTLKGAIYDDVNQIAVMVSTKKYGAEGEAKVTVCELSCVNNPRWLIANIKRTVEAGTR